MLSAVTLADLARFLADKIAGGSASYVVRSTVDSHLQKRQKKEAFSAAVEVALASFGAEFPDLADSFFDKAFATGPAADELAKLQDLKGKPTASRLAELYARQFTSASVPEDLVEAACARFIELLHEALTASPALRDHVNARLLRDLHHRHRSGPDDTLRAELDELMELIRTRSGPGPDVVERINALPARLKFSSDPGLRIRAYCLESALSIKGNDEVLENVRRQRIRLARFARLDTPERPAAMWHAAYLAVVELALIQKAGTPCDGQETVLGLRLLAANGFGSIRPARGPLSPIWLPGLPQEIPLSASDALGSSGLDPLATQVDQPYRLWGASLSAAALLIDDERQRSRLLHEAATCSTSLRNVHPGAEIPC